MAMTMATTPTITGPVASQKYPARLGEARRLPLFFTYVSFAAIFFLKENGD